MLFKNKILVLIFLAFIFGFLIFFFINNEKNITVIEQNEVEPKKYIKWVDFSVPYIVLEKALKLDISSQGTQTKLDFINMLSYLGAKYGGNYKNYKVKDLDALVNRLKNGDDMASITQNMKYYNYYNEAYTAVLAGFVGNYKIEAENKNNPKEKIVKEAYGLKVFSPIAKGYYFNHYDDFGDARSFGFKRKHLGNDLMAGIGTPVIAVEGGTVEAAGWNIYGGWRVGIRSFDKKRYYYYAHLRKDKPFHKDLQEGKTVLAGDVIGYLGMTGYSTKENVNNITKPHLHFGMQIIFDEVQKDGINQIWIDVYNIVRLLQKNKSTVYKDPATKEFYRLYNIIE